MNWKKKPTKIDLNRTSLCSIELECTPLPIQTPYESGWGGDWMKLYKMIKSVKTWRLVYTIMRSNKVPKKRSFGNGRIQCLWRSIWTRCVPFSIILRTKWFIPWKNHISVPLWPIKNWTQTNGVKWFIKKKSETTICSTINWRQPRRISRVSNARRIIVPIINYKHVLQMNPWLLSSRASIVRAIGVVKIWTVYLKIIIFLKTEIIMVVFTIQS